MVLSGDNRLEFGLDLRPLVLEHAGGALEQGVAPESAGAVSWNGSAPRAFPPRRPPR